MWCASFCLHRHRRYPNIYGWWFYNNNHFIYSVMCTLSLVGCAGLAVGPEERPIKSVIQLFDRISERRRWRPKRMVKQRKLYAITIDVNILVFEYWEMDMTMVDKMITALAHQKCEIWSSASCVGWSRSGRWIWMIPSMRDCLNDSPRIRIKHPRYFWDNSRF